MPPATLPQEIELKLALPTGDPAGLARRLASLPVLSRLKAVHLKLHNIYFDSPDQLLHGQKMALRVRQIGTEAAPTWVQTLKIGKSGESALSQRAEWEEAVPDGRLNLDNLLHTPWAEFDPTGQIFRALRPMFVTQFDRTSWIVKRRNGSAVEVSLDIGQVTVEGKSTPICELELELLKGTPDALFDIARSIARALPLLPLGVSKSERGFALEQGTMHQPVRARPPVLTTTLTLPELAKTVLQEMFLQFTANLNILRVSDDPEVLHQARVGWRRFRGALKWFRNTPILDLIPLRDPLGPLLTAMTDMRDLDVAQSETLPMFANAYTAGDAHRQQQWRALKRALGAAAQLQHQRLRNALEAPAVGATLIAITQWLEGIPSRDQPKVKKKKPTDTTVWARACAERLHGKLKAAPAYAKDPKIQHRTRILSKKMRYCVESLQSLLPEKRARRWHQSATRLQEKIGSARDIMQTLAIVASLEVDTELVAFLQRTAAGTKP